MKHTSLAQTLTDALLQVWKNQGYICLIDDWNILIDSNAAHGIQMPMPYDEIDSK